MRHFITCTYDKTIGVYPSSHRQRAPHGILGIAVGSNELDLATVFKDGQVGFDVDMVSLVKNQKR